MNHQIQQLVARIEDLYGEGGAIQPRLVFSLNINNRNDCAFEVLNMVARLHAQFSEEGRGIEPGVGAFVNFGTREYGSTISQGEQNSLTLHFPFPFEVFLAFENERRGRDVIFQVNISCTAMERSPQAQIGPRFLTAEMVDSRGNNQYIGYQVPRSRWLTFLNALGYSEEVRISKQALAQAVEEAKRASEEAESYAQTAKAASSLTAVTTLSQAYQEEAKALRKASRQWLGATTVMAILGGFLIETYVRQSLHAEFGVPQALIRAGAILAVLGAFGFCLKNYNVYQHLELLNRHRVNIGRTFQALQGVQPSPEARNLLAAITSEQMIHFGRISSGAKDATETQVSLLTEFLKSFLEHQKSS